MHNGKQEVSVGYVYAMESEYPNLVRLYNLHILNKLDYSPVGGVVEVPAQYAPWLHDLEQVAATLSQDYPAPEDTDTTLVMRATGAPCGLQDTEMFSVVAGDPELLMALEARGPETARLVAYVQDMCGNWQSQAWKRTEFKDFA